MNDRVAPRVLYVEDDRIHLILMEELFRRLPGWELHCAETGAEALAMLGACRPGLVLVDMNLPDMTGVELRLRAAAQAVEAAADEDGARWVALSADDPVETVRAARAAGFDDYWLKPVEVARLQGVLQQLQR